MVATLEPGQELGIVHDFLIEGANGEQVRCVILRTVGTLDTIFLGGTRDVIVPMAALHFAGRGDMARLDLSADQLRDAPAFQDSDTIRLQSDTDWQRSIAACYGIVLVPAAPAAMAPPAAAAHGALMPSSAQPTDAQRADGQHG